MNGDISYAKLIGTVSAAFAVLTVVATTGYLFGRNEIAADVRVLRSEVLADTRAVRTEITALRRDMETGDVASQQSVIMHDAKESHGGAVSRREIELILTEIRADIGEIRDSLTSLRGQVDR